MTTTTRRIIGLTLSVLFALMLCVATAGSAKAQQVTPYEAKLYRLAAYVKMHGKPCKTEDSASTPCYWDARKRGNGKGESFVVLIGKRFGHRVPIYVYEGGGIEI